MQNNNNRDHTFFSITTMRKTTIFLMFLLLVFGCPYICGQDCDELLKKANKYQRDGKDVEAEKYYNMVKNSACDQKNKKKAEDKLRPIIATKTKPVRATTLTITPDSDVIIPYYGGEYALKVSGASSWEVNTESDWCQIRKEGNTIVIKCPDVNTSMQNRIANVIVKSGSRSKTIVVNNEGAPEMLRSSVRSINFPYSGACDSIDIYTNSNWRIDSSPQWVTAVRKGDHIELQAGSNEQDDERSGNVVISTPSSTTVIINIFQSAVDDNLFISKDNLTFGPDGGDEYIKVTNAPSLKIETKPKWIKIDPIGTDSLRIHCDANLPMDFDRDCHVFLRNGQQHAEIYLFQEAKPLPYMLPSMGIGGRPLSFGVNVGYIHPMISTSADGDFIGSVVNYSLANNNEAASYTVSGGFTFGAFADIRLYKNIYLMAGINYLQYSYKNVFNADVNRIKPIENESTGQLLCYLAGNTQNRYTEDYKINQLEMPILASYRFPVTKMSHVQVNLGPLINYGLSAKMNNSGYTSSESSYYYAIENGQRTENKYDIHIQSIHDKEHAEFNLYDKYVNYVIVNKEGQSNKMKTNTEDVPLKRVNFGMRLGVSYEYYGVRIGAEYTYMFTNMANDKYWNGNRWEIFDQHASTLMSGYKQRNHYLGISLSFTLRHLGL